MNWEKLSEKLSKDGKKVTIFCDRDDRDDDFISKKMDYYRGKGLAVLLRNFEFPRKDRQNVEKQL